MKILGTVTDCTANDLSIKKLRFVGLIKTNLTKNKHTAILCTPHNEVGFSKPFLRLGDNTPQLKAVFLCLPFLGKLKFEPIKSIMTALFWQPLWLVSPSRDIANRYDAVTRFLAKSCDGFTHFRLGVTA